MECQGSVYQAGRSGLGRQHAERAGTDQNPKINLQRVENFSTPKMIVKISTFYQQRTTHLPSKNHVLHPVFRKTPSKNALFPGIKKSESQISWWKELIRSVSSALQGLPPHPLPKLQPPKPARYEQDSSAAPSSSAPEPDYASESPDKSRGASPPIPSDLLHLQRFCCDIHTDSR